MKNSPNLKSCPFCGSKAAIITELSFAGVTYRIGCQNGRKCAIRYLQTKPYYKKSEAIEAWNKRSKATQC